MIYILDKRKCRCVNTHNASVLTSSLWHALMLDKGKHTPDAHWPDPITNCGSELTGANISLQNTNKWVMLCIFQIYGCRLPWAYSHWCAVAMLIMQQMSPDMYVFSLLNSKLKNSSSESDTFSTRTPRLVPSAPSTDCSDTRGRSDSWRSQSPRTGSQREQRSSTPGERSWYCPGLSWETSWWLWWRRGLRGRCHHSVPIPLERQKSPMMRPCMDLGAWEYANSKAVRNRKGKLGIEWHFLFTSTKFFVRLWKFHCCAVNWDACVFSLNPLKTIWFCYNTHFP